jgi:hypothetical protein
MFQIETRKVPIKNWLGDARINTIKTRLLTEKFCVFLFLRELYELLNRTVALGESNTCILIGPSGCGKTAVSFFTLSSNMISLNISTLFRFFFIF